MQFLIDNPSAHILEASLITEVDFESAHEIWRKHKGYIESHRARAGLGASGDSSG